MITNQRPNLNNINKNNCNEKQSLVLELSWNYWTFSNHQNKKQPPENKYNLYSLSVTSWRMWWIILSFLFLGKVSFSFFSSWNHSSPRDIPVAPHSYSDSSFHSTRCDQGNHDITINNYNNDNRPWMIWDYNAYHASTTTTTYNSLSSSSENSFNTNDALRILLAQQQQEDNDERTRTIFSTNDPISLPNRAYAKQHGMDYVRLYGKQTWLDLFVFPSIYYDMIVFLPPTAIMIQFDQSLLEVLPTKEQFMTVGPTTGFFVVNVQHSYAPQTIQQWQTMSWELDTISATTETETVRVVYPWSILLPKASHYITFLPESNGFIGNRLIQCFHHLPTSKNDDDDDDDLVTTTTTTTTTADIQMSISTTVASVCYRYYPKCEVL